jgi:hypothetical protein
VRIVPRETSMTLAKKIIKPVINIMTSKYIKASIFSGSKKLIFGFAIWKG